MIPIRTRTGSEFSPLESEGQAISRFEIEINSVFRRQIVKKWSGIGFIHW